VPEVVDTRSRLVTGAQFVVRFRVQIARPQAAVSTDGGGVACPRLAGAALLARAVVGTELPILRIVVQRIVRRREVVKQTEGMADLMELNALVRLPPQVLIDGLGQGVLRQVWILFAVVGAQTVNIGTSDRSGTIEMADTLGSQRPQDLLVCQGQTARGLALDRK